MVLADSHKISRVPCYSGTACNTHAMRFVYGTLTHSGPVSHQVRLHTTRNAPTMLGRTHTPHNTVHATPARLHAHGLGSSSFARHYSRNHSYFLLLRVLRCFTSPRSPHTPYIFRCGSPYSHTAGFPHSDTLGTPSVYRLPEAYRRFPRPSSAPDAKASTMRPSTLTHTHPQHPFETVSQAYQVVYAWSVT